MSRFDDLTLEELRGLAIHFGNKLSSRAYTNDYDDISELMILIGEIGLAMRTEFMGPDEDDTVKNVIGNIHRIQDKDIYTGERKKLVIDD